MVSNASGVSRFRPSYRALVSGLLVTLLCAGCFRAGAQTAIPGLYNTGVDSSGGLLALGAADPHYTLISSADPVFPGPSAFVADPPHPAWTPNTAISQWIAPNADTITTGNTPGNYIYRTFFDLTGLNPANAQISGSWSVDNQRLAILLNGVDMGTGDDPTSIVDFVSLHAFTLDHGFISGQNTLDFELFNQDGTSGLHVTSLQGAITPEGNALTLLSSLLAFGGVLILRRHGRCKAPANMQSIDPNEGLLC